MNIKNHTMKIVEFLFNNPKPANMKSEKLSKILGRNVEVGEVLSDADYALVEAAIPNEEAGAPAAETAPTVDVASAIATAIAPLAQSIETVAAQVVALKIDVAALGEKPGASSAADTTAPKNTTNEENVDFEKFPWLNPDSAINKLADSQS